MDETCKKMLVSVGIHFSDLNELDGFFFPREQLLSDTKYDEIKYLIPELKKIFSSSFMTSLQKNADKSQKWPLLNLIRQILNVYGYQMKPIRKSDGYTLEGIKKYKRFFQIEKKYFDNKNNSYSNNNNNDNDNDNDNDNNDNDIKKIEYNDNDYNISNNIENF
jgi:hypothetical protein